MHDRQGAALRQVVLKRVGAPDRPAAEPAPSVAEGTTISKKLDARIDAILQTAQVVDEAERERTDVKTSIGRLAGVDVPFLVSYITQLEAVIAALQEEKVAMERFDAAIGERDEAQVADLSQVVMDAGRQVEQALEALERWKLLTD